MMEYKVLKSFWGSKSGFTLKRPKHAWSNGYSKRSRGDKYIDYEPLSETTMELEGKGYIKLVKISNEK